MVGIDTLIISRLLQLRRHYSPRSPPPGSAASGEWRQRSKTQLTIRGAASTSSTRTVSRQRHPDAGFHDFRGAIEASGRFNLSPQWTWASMGWADRPDLLSGYKIQLLQQTAVDPISTT